MEGVHRKKRAGVRIQGVSEEKKAYGVGKGG